MLELRLTPPAYHDFNAIADYTISRFGYEQADAYADQLLFAMDRLVQNPYLGSSQEQILAGTRRLVHESHSIYYKVTQSSILVLRILGPGQDPLREL